MTLHVHAGSFQPVDEVPGLGRSQIVHDAAGGHSTHVVDLRQRLLRGCHQGIHGAKMHGQHLGRLLTYLTDAQAVDQLGEVVLLGLGDGTNQVVRRLFAHPVQLGHVLCTQAVQICRIGHQAIVHQLLEHRGAAAVNIHGVPAGEMGEVAQQLCRALRTGAAQRSAVLIPHHRRAADGALLRQRIGHRALRSLGEVHLHDLRNDLTGLLHHNGVPHPDILFGDSTARGVGTPVRPTCTTISNTWAGFFSGGYLNATAHLGNLAVEPSMARSARESSFTTAPSMSKG